MGVEWLVFLLEYINLKALVRQVGVRQLKTVPLSTISFV